MRLCISHLEQGVSDKVMPIGKEVSEMSAVLGQRAGPEPEERACKAKNKGQKKGYVEPQLTREEVLPDITGDPDVPISPWTDLHNNNTNYNH